ncbi:hypothetical protein WR25_26795 [Diploscapter pachys]|uniref:Uncharacterized protein n=1 Tax=Diploscapter pachys TaxID=2018661 RepID=A0A2A2LKI7_9BILA|nr:hypothetical protein WR25_26795 [Diploscapter pachys]
MYLCLSASLRLSVSLYLRSAPAVLTTSLQTGRASLFPSLCSLHSILYFSTEASHDVQSRARREQKEREKLNIKVETRHTSMQREELGDENFFLLWKWIFSLVPYRN